MTPIYLTFLRISGWLALLLGICLGPALPVTINLPLAYPWTNSPRLPLSLEDLPFGLKLAKFFRGKLQLKKIQGQICLAGSPDRSALLGGSLLAALHGLAAAAGCQEVKVDLTLSPNAPTSTGKIFLKISLPLWAIIAAGMDTAAYFWRRRRKLKPANN